MELEYGVRPAVSIDILQITHVCYVKCLDMQDATMSGCHARARAPKSAAWMRFAARRTMLPSHLFLTAQPSLKHGRTEHSACLACNAQPSGTYCFESSLFVVVGIEDMASSKLESRK